MIGCIKVKVMAEMKKPHLGPISEGTSLNIMTEAPEKEILTVEILAQAIKAAIGQNNIPKEQAIDMAEHMLNFFGFHDEIIDNMLEPQDRDVFYTLEDYGLMATEREETTLWDGREWRINYWRFKKEKVFKLANHGAPEEDGDNKNELRDLYDSVPEEYWMSKSE